MSSDEIFGVSVAEMYFIVSVLAVFSVFGSVGNALVLYVFSTAKDDLVSTLFIIVLAVVDFSTCIIIIPFTIIVELIQYNVRFDLACKLYQFLITSNIPFSALIMTAIAVDRYLCICHPFARLLTLRRARVVVLVLAAFAVVLGVIGALTHSVYKRDRDIMNTTNQSAITQLTLTLPVTSDNHSSVINDKVLYTGYCAPTDLILSEQFALAFQKCYTAIFVVCLAIVVVLYSLIYRSVLRQRHKRQQMKTVSTRVQATSIPNTAHQRLTVDTASSPAATCRDIVLSQQDNDDESRAAAVEIISLSPAADDKSAGKKLSTEAAPMNQTPAAAEAARRNRIANIKTAAMLFVVTLVFTVSFFPALAMTVFLIPYNMIIFYMYFANNVANPVIYSFMNNNFRKRLTRLLCKS